MLAKFPCIDVHDDELAVEDLNYIRGLVKRFHFSVMDIEVGENDNVIIGLSWSGK